MKLDYNGVLFALQGFLDCEVDVVIVTDNIPISLIRGTLEKIVENSVAFNQVISSLNEQLETDRFGSQGELFGLVINTGQEHSQCPRVYIPEDLFFSAFTTKDSDELHVILKSGLSVSLTLLEA